MAISRKVSGDTACLNVSVKQDIREPTDELLKAC